MGWIVLLVLLVVTYAAPTGYTPIATGQPSLISSWTNSGGQFSVKFPIHSLDTNIPAGQVLVLELAKSTAVSIGSVWSSYVSWTTTSQSSTFVSANLTTLNTITPSLLASFLEICFNLQASRAALASDISNVVLYRYSPASLVDSPTRSPSTSPTALPTLTPTSTPTSASPFTLYVNCGLQTVDSAGRTWITDTAYAVGGSLFTSPSPYITNPIIKSERWWRSSTVTNSSGARIRVPESGTYMVTVYLAEIYFSTAGKRIFNVMVNDQLISSSPIDLAKSYAFATLQAFAVTVNVTSGVINIVVVPSVENPKISAFSVQQVQAATPSTQPTSSPSVAPTLLPSASPSFTPTILPTNVPAFPTLFVNSGPTVTDSTGQVWTTDVSYSRGGSFSETTFPSISDILVRSERWWSSVNSSSGYSIPVNLIGTYSVTIYLAEMYFQQAGKRTFNVQVNGIPISPSLIDLYSSYGFGTLASFSLDVVVTAGTINIVVIKGIENPKISAFKVDYKSSSIIPPTSAPTVYTPPTPALTRLPTTAPFAAPVTTPAFCKSIRVYDDFSSGDFSSSLKISSNCGTSVSVGSNSRNSTKKSLYLNLPNGCGASKVSTHTSYGGGYWETSLRIGGQGNGFSGVVYAWYLRECDSCTSNFNEIDFEWLGLSKYIGQTQTNWFLNGVGASKNEMYYTGVPRSPYNGFERYGIYWDNNKIEWYINGQLVRTQLNTGVTTSRPMDLYVSIWDGSAFKEWCGAIDWNSPSKNNFLMEVEYVMICSI